MATFSISNAAPWQPEAADKADVLQIALRPTAGPRGHVMEGVDEASSTEAAKMRSGGMSSASRRRSLRCSSAIVLVIGFMLVLFQFSADIGGYGFRAVSQFIVRLPYLVSGPDRLAVEKLVRDNLEISNRAAACIRPVRWRSR